MNTFMLKTSLLVLGFYLLLFASVETFANQKLPSLDDAQLKEIGKKIYHNETGSNPKYLLAWNEGEAFASMGIGHFIWFPEDSSSPFTETFPGLVAYLKAQGVLLPTWLTADTDCIWNTKAEFLAQQDSSKAKELRNLMQSTFSHQVAFIYQRMQSALPLMLENIEDPLQTARITDTFYQLANSELGMYSLIDYVNFKGEGISMKERYKSQGWGLLQVLQNIPSNAGNVNQAFAEACDRVLTRRVKNSPQAEVEQKWLAGWRNRCSTYK